MTKTEMYRDENKPVVIYLLPNGLYELINEETEEFLTVAVVEEALYLMEVGAV